MCDFAQYKQKRDDWVECISGDDINSITQQLIRMTYFVSTYKTLNELVRMAPDVNGDSSKGKMLNGPLFKLLRITVVDSYLIRIRRLVEESTTKHRLKGSRSVYSMAALLDDMIEHAELYTRGNTFAYENLTYDPEEVREKREQHYRDHPELFEEGVHFLPLDLDCQRVVDRHLEFDHLSRTDASSRSKNDHLSIDFLTELKNQLIAITENAVANANKLVAHAATPESREFVDLESRKISMESLWDVHRHLEQLAQYVDTFLLSRASRNSMMIHPHNQLKHLELPLLTGDTQCQLQTFWNELVDEVDEWGRISVDYFQ